eukprot:TRINITY_DN8000_c0_g2_i1.p1 TRINITY_DN8000_c0_g2~~TRINITY_DN8000_c0_g2_i1.p1  ORF type:complete len:399 (+),score=83.09 TRINITY_DN8000_c0_g2_i1:107-1303(+)
MSSQNSPTEWDVIPQDLASWSKEMNRLRTQVAEATADSQQKTQQIVSLTTDIAAIKLQVQQLTALVGEKVGNIVFDQSIRDINALLGQKVATHVFEQRMAEITVLMGQKVPTTLFEQCTGDLATILGRKVANDVFEQRMEEINALVGQKIANNVFEQRLGEINALGGHRVANDVFKQRIGDIDAVVEQKVPTDFFEQRVEEINALVEQKVANNVFEQRIGEIITLVEQHVTHNLFEERIGEITLQMEQKVDSDAFEDRLRAVSRPRVNKAISAFGATVASGTHKPKNGGHLLSGGAHQFDGRCGFAWARNEYVTVRWTAPVLIAVVGFRLWDQEDRNYTYTFEYSDQQDEWHNVCLNRSGKSWQWFTLPDNVVKVSALRWQGENSANESFHIVELETY